MGSRNPVHCIVPPILLERIARNGNAVQRDWALATMAKDQSLRAQRIHNATLKLMSFQQSPVAVHVPRGKPFRTIRDAQNKEHLSGPAVREEGQGASGDRAVDEAFEGFGHTFGFFWDAFQRNSIDDDGMHLEGVVHYGRNYDNAFWDGQRMVFGDGDGELFNRFTASLDVIAHELAHGVTEDESGLAYLGEAGALNESMSDVYGSCVRQYVRGEKAEDADWLIGAELFTDKVKGAALRSMKAPGTAFDDPVLGKDPQPAHMKDFVETSEDNGGVHVNSGIPNHAFYTTAVTLGGASWERAARVWYEATKFGRLRSSAKFAVFAAATVQTAARLYGKDSEESRAVQAGWDKVGVPV